MAMTATFTFEFTQDECAIIADALEVDLDGYVEAAEAAFAQGQKDDAKTFAESAARVRAVLERMREAVPED